jgi:hypothetical protein
VLKFFAVIPNPLPYYDAPCSGCRRGSTIRGGCSSWSRLSSRTITRDIILGNGLIRRGICLHQGIVAGGSAAIVAGAPVPRPWRSVSRQVLPWRNRTGGGEDQHRVQRRHPCCRHRPHRGPRASDPRGGQKSRGSNLRTRQGALHVDHQMEQGPQERQQQCHRRIRCEPHPAPFTRSREPSLQ